MNLLDCFVQPLPGLHAEFWVYYIVTSAIRLNTSSFLFRSQQYYSFFHFTIHITKTSFLFLFSFLQLRWNFRHRKLLLCRTPLFLFITLKVNTKDDSSEQLSLHLPVVSYIGGVLCEYDKRHNAIVVCLSPSIRKATY